MTAPSVQAPSWHPHGSHPVPVVPQPRRRRRWVLGLVGLLVLALLATAGWLVGFSSVFTTRHVKVTGMRALRADEVRAAAAVPTGRPLVRQRLGPVADRVAALRVVRSVEVSRRWPDTVLIDVRERTPKLAIAQPGGFVLVDDQGQAYLSVATAPTRVPIAEVDPGNAALLSRVAVVAQALPQDLQRHVRSIRARTPDGISLRLRDGDEVFWGTADQSELKCRVLRALLPRPATRYDVSAPLSPALR